MGNIMLYHGTSEGNYSRISKEGKIANSYNIDDLTEIINELISEYGDEPNLRDGAIFLFNDITKAAVYDYILTVDTKNLNVSNLFVGDFRTATDIFSNHIKGGDNLLTLVKSYESNFVSYEEYLNNKDKIQIPEFLYFSEIPLSLITKTIEASIDWMIDEYL